MLEPSVDHKARLLNGFKTNARIDQGVATLKSEDSLQLEGGRIIKPPFQIEASLYRDDPEIPRREPARPSFEIRFAQVSPCLLLFAYSEAGGDNGVFCQTDEGRRPVKLWPLVGKPSGKKINISISYGKNAWTVTRNGRSISGREHADGLGSLISISDSLPSLLWLDRFKVTDGAGTVLGGDWGPAPLLVGLNDVTGLLTDSTLYVMLAVLLLCLVGFLFDVTVARLGIARKTALTLPGLLLLLLPLQGALLATLSALFNLTFYATAISFCLFGLAKLSGVWTPGLWQGSQRRKAGVNPLVAAGLGLTLYAVMLDKLWHLLSGAWLASPAVVDGAFPANLGGAFPTIMGCILALTPLVALALGVWRIGWQTALALPLVSAQFFLYYWVDSVDPSTEGALPFVIAFAPWLAAMAVDLRRTHRRKLVPLLYGLAVLSFLLLGAELSLWSRVATKTIKSGITELRWDVVRTTNLLRNHDKATSVEVMTDQVYPTKKAAGVRRIVALGSSSTFGIGVREPARDSYPAQLQKVLDESEGAGRFEVINGGLSGVLFTAIRIYFKEVLSRLKPDIVVIYFGVNGDGPDAETYHKMLVGRLGPKPFQRTNEDVWLTLLSRADSEVGIRTLDALTRSNVFLYGLWSLSTLRASLLVSLGLRAARLGDPPPEYVVRSVERAVEAGLSVGARVVLVPEVCHNDVLGLAEEGGNCSRYRKVFLEVSKKYAGKGVYYGDLVPHFDKKKLRRYMVDDVHMNSAGYRFLAEKVAGLLGQVGLLK